MYTGIIYCATLPSNKKYFGFTIDFENRKRSHKCHANAGTQNKFYNAIRKYGWDSIQWDIIEEFKSESKKDLREILSKREIYWINESQSYTNGYNGTKGGDGVLGLTWREESKEKLSKTQEGRVLSESWKEHIGLSGLGREVTKETRDKIGLKNKGNDFCLGVIRSQNTKDKMAISKIGSSNPMYGKTPWNKKIKSEI
jgi:group I intron endonuclease